MKSKQKKTSKSLLSDKIADALTVKPSADIEDDQVFGTKPKTVSRVDLESSESEDETAISDFRKRNVNLLSDISKKYKGEVVTRKELENSDDGGYEESDSEDESNLLTTNELSLNDKDESSDDSCYELKEKKIKASKEKTKSPLVNSVFDKIRKQIQASDSEDEPTKSTKTSQEKSDTDLSSSEGESDDYDITQLAKKNYKQSNKSESGLSSDDGDSNGDDINSFKKQFMEKSKKVSLKPQNEESDDEYIIQVKKQIEGSDDSDNEEESEDGSDSGDQDGEDDDEGEGYDISQMDEPMKEEFEHVKKQNVSEEVKKGACVRNQLLLWEGLLEMRIHLQRCMNTANQMPLPETHENLKTNNDFVDECNIAKANIATVLDKLLFLQNKLYKNFPETKNLSTKKQSTNPEPEKKEESDEEIPSETDNEEIPSDTENEEEAKPQEKSPKTNTTQQAKKRKLEDYEKELATSHKAFKSFRDTTIQKWNDKTRLATAANIKNAPTNTILQQISYILSDREKLVRRTQLKRSEYDIVGYKKAEKEQDEGEILVTKGRKDDDEYISEIFDDSDFYHQLLRELIECKSADISDPVQLSRQWIALQQMRSKMKRKVDTKATKGRKIKYVVHNQLVNFMAPEKCTTWTDESTNELYSSLFGKMFEHNNVGLSANVENGFKLTK